MSYEHVTVLLNEVCDTLTAEAPEESLFGDLTFGGGGHTRGFLERLSNARVIAVDQDPDVIANFEQSFSQEEKTHVSLVKSNFVNFPEVVRERFSLELEKFHGFRGIVLDLGVSSHHFDSSTRGFSFRSSGPLDMRMDYKSNLTTAKEVVNEYPEDDLIEILKNYGEERFARQIVKNILSARKENEIETTKDLEDIIFHSYPKKLRFGRLHPATKTFQALRTYVNRELEVLTEVLGQLPDLLCIGGKLAVISFHSLEDRIVKHKFRDLSRNGPYKLINKKPIIPTDEEIRKNSRARSAKLRIIERVDSKEG